MATTMNEPDEDAARVRAAQAWAGITDEEFAERLGVARRTIGRLKSGAAPVDLERRGRIAEACGVPQWFMATGFAAAPEPEDPTLAERVEALEGRLGTIESLLADVRRRL